MSFVEAQAECIGDNYDGTPFAGLMPVGKLREFINYYKYNDSTHDNHR